VPSHLEGKRICEIFLTFTLNHFSAVTGVIWCISPPNLPVKNKSQQYGHSPLSLLQSYSVSTRVGFLMSSFGWVVFENLISKFLIVGTLYFYPVSFAELFPLWASFLTSLLPLFFSLVAFFFLLRLIFSRKKNFLTSVW
jgi:hypothetical protein